MVGIDFMIDGEVRWIDNKNNYSKRNALFRCIPIANKLSGPLYTIIKSYPEISNDTINIYYSIEYRRVDYDFDTEFMDIVLHPNTLSQTYSIYPSFIQIAKINNLIEEFDELTDVMTIVNLGICVNDTNINLVPEIMDYIFDIPKSVKNVFKKLNMKTCVHSIIGIQYLIIKNNKWKIVESILDRSGALIPFDYIVVNTKFESCYILTRKEYIRFNNIKEFCIKRIMFDGIESCLYINQFDEIIMYCVLYPLYERMASVLSPNREFSLEINVDNIIVYYTKKEVDAGVQLFEVINRLLSM